MEQTDHGFHLSLSKCLYLKEHQLDDFANAIQKQLEDSQRSGRETWAWYGVERKLIFTLVSTIDSQCLLPNYQYSRMKIKHDPL